MDKDTILEVGLDNELRLYIKPSSTKFPYIYREAVEVHWNKDKAYLFGAELRSNEDSWGYVEWFRHILSAARLQSTELSISSETKWVNIPDSLKKTLESL